MKRYIWTLVMLLLLPGLVVAAPAKKKSNKKSSNSKVVHNVSAWGGGGYSGLVNGCDNNKFVGGGGGLIGFGYELRDKRFMFTTGPEFRIFSSADKVSFPYQYDVIMLYDETMMTKHYTFGPEFKESHTVAQIMLPVMAGMQFDYVYFLAGAKIGYTVLGNYKQEGSLTTTMTDPMAYDKSWANMPAVGLFTDAPYASAGKNAYGLDAALSAEVGLLIDDVMNKNWRKQNNQRKYPYHMRVALFADYGLRNLKAGSYDMAVADENTITTSSLHASQWANRLNSLLVGVKFTALLQLNKPKKVSPKAELPQISISTYEEQTGSHLGNVQLAITNTKNNRVKRVATDASGHLEYSTAVGDYTIAATRKDYDPAEVVSVNLTEAGASVSIGLNKIPMFRYVVVDAKTGAPIKANTTITDLSTNQVISEKPYDPETGELSVKLARGKNYQIRVEQTDYFSLTQQFQLTDELQTYRLSQIEKKKPMILHNLFFATNETTILPESEAGLQDLYTLLSENPSIRIRITGHTDSVGSDRDNQKLSEGRAESVRQAMIQRGIAADRMEAVGKGKAEPIASNDTEEGRAQNRRVEFMIL